ncbi:MAG: AURKAIP1/COX24 domain-containing protein [Nitrospirota bacterium]
MHPPEFLHTHDDPVLSDHLTLLVRADSLATKRTCLLGPKRTLSLWDYSRTRCACIFSGKLLDSPLFEEIRSMSSVLKKRRKKMRKHKYKKLRQRQKFLRRKS